MTQQTLFLVLHVALCLGVAWLGFCRLTKTGKSTRLYFRVANSARAVSALALAAAPFYWHLVVIWPLLAFEASVLMANLATARMWRDGVPPGLLK